MVLVAPRSAKLVEARGARFTLLFGYVFVLLGFLTMLLLWKEDIAVLEGRRSATRSSASASGSPARPASHSLTGSVPVRRVGMASGTADLQRDLGGAIMQSIFGALLTAGYAAAAASRDRASSGRARHRAASQAELTKSFVERRGRRAAVPAVREPDHRRGEGVVPRTATSGPTPPASSRSLLGAALVFFLLPAPRAGARLLARYQRRGRLKCGHGRRTSCADPAPAS